jgi:hypothetical protein
MIYVIETLVDADLCSRFIAYRSRADQIDSERLSPDADAVVSYLLHLTHPCLQGTENPALPMNHYMYPSSSQFGMSSASVDQVPQ